MTHDDAPHIEEFKIRLRPADADLLRALAAKKDVPPAVLLRSLVMRELGPVAYSVPTATTTRRPA
jgi:hypothetical protein